MTGLLSQPEEGPEQPKDTGLHPLPQAWSCRPSHITCSSSSRIPTADSKSRGREGRVILMHHLAELGYTDSVIHAQVRRQA